jgi:glutathione S-transferase
VIRLWRAPWSTNVERVALALAYKNLEVESVVISYDDRSPVEAVSGQGLVPVIEDDGEVIADSAQILEHLDRRYPSPPLYPAGPARRAEVELFVDWFNRVWKLAPNAIEAELTASEPDQARIDALSAEMRDRLGLFEHLLAGRDHLFGDFGVADCIAFPFLKFAAGRDPADEELFHRVLEDYQRPAAADLPRLRAWIERVDGRPRAY